jgi:hypothetical protein
MPSRPSGNGLPLPIWQPMATIGDSDSAVPREPRTRPLALLIADEELILLGDDVNALVDSIDKLIAATYDALRRTGGNDSRIEVSQQAIAEYEELAVVLSTAGSRLGDPPVEIDRERTRLLRQVVADLDGYQRRELTPGLLDLRKRLA